MMKHGSTTRYSIIGLVLIIFLAILIARTQTKIEISKIQTPEISPLKPQSSVEVPILIYHYIREVDPRKDYLGADLSVSPKKFEEQLAWLQKNNYTTVTLDDIILAWEIGIPLPKKPVILTFDDGYDDFFSTAYPLLQKYSTKATAYIVTSFLESPRYMKKSQIQELAASPLITIASHTEHHFDMRKLKISRLREELIKSKKFLEELTGKTIRHFAYPFGYHTQGIAEEVKKAGYETAAITGYGTEHKPENRFTMRRVRIAGGLTIEKFSELIEGKP